jgi:hypothetical protein
MDELTDASSVDVAFQALKPLRLPDFVHPYRDLPSDATAAIEKLIDAFVGADSMEKDAMTKRVEKSFAFVFPRYAYRAAIESVRMNAPELLKTGLIALAIENANFDWRDTLPYLAFIYNSARKLNVDPSELFHDAAAIACSPFRTLLESFLNRDEVSRKVEFFHYKESGEGVSFDYVYVEPPSHLPSPTVWKIRIFLQRLRRVLPR